MTTKRKVVNFKKEDKSKKGGLTAKGRAKYNKATGGNLKAPVTGKVATDLALEVIFCFSSTTSRFFCFNNSISFFSRSISAELSTAAAGFSSAM